ncbi:MAG TPA: ACT domain-containing protein [Syntrophomonadaceae bacterium]|nr:ACT domain-containing protein [Syntrophomonadaceae bacterium]
MPRDEKRFFMVREDVLPDSIRKTALVKEMLARGEASNILEAVEQFDIARSTFYKYRDGVCSFFNAENMNIMTISLLLQHISGILSGVLNCIASLNGNILTINQNLPLNGEAMVTISVSAEEMVVTEDEFLLQLRHQPGVVNVELVGRS